MFGVALSSLISLMVLFLYSPYWLVNNFSALINSPGYPALGGDASANPLGLLVNQAAGLWQQWTADVPLPVLVLLVIGIFTALTGNRRAQLLAGAIIISHLPMLFIVGAHEPPPRIWQYLLPVILIIAASGILRVLSVAPVVLRNSFAVGLLAIALSLSGFFASLADESELVSYRERPYQKASLQGVADTLVSSLTPGTLALSYYQNFENVHYYFHFFKRSVERAGFTIRPIITETANSLKIVQICEKHGPCTENASKYCLFTDIPLDKSLNLFSNSGLTRPDASRAELIHHKHSGLSVYRLPGVSP